MQQIPRQESWIGEYITSEIMNLDPLLEKCLGKFSSILEKLFHKVFQNGNHLTQFTANCSYLQVASACIYEVINL